MASHRFIPACAGNSHFLFCPIILAPVHPRVCGEQIQTPLGAQCESGSSPRVRGTECSCQLE